MERFLSVEQAKEFLISTIAEAAAAEGVPLSDLEKKILKFTETGSDAKPEYLDVAAEFDKQYDQHDF